MLHEEPERPIPTETLELLFWLEFALVVVEMELLASSVWRPLIYVVVLLINRVVDRQKTAAI